MAVHDAPIVIIGIEKTIAKIFKKIKSAILLIKTIIGLSKLKNLFIYSPLAATVFQEPTNGASLRCANLASERFDKSFTLLHPNNIKLYYFFTPKAINL